MEIEDKKQLGARIKAEREAMGISQDVLAEKLQMKRTNIANYEAGRVLPPSNILKELAVIFGVNTDYLLGLSGARRADDDSLNPKYDNPSWATSKDKRDFKKMLEEDAPVMFDGVPINEDDREKIKRVMEAIFWDAKEKNKQTYGSRKKSTDG